MMTPEEQAYVRKLEETIVKLEVRIAELERRLNMNSSNSSKPPSTDNPNQKKRSLRRPSRKKPGGQSGHKGTTLSTGFIHNAVKKYAGKLDDAISSIKTAIYSAPVVHAEETGVRASGKYLPVPTIADYTGDIGKA